MQHKLHIKTPAWPSNCTPATKLSLWLSLTLSGSLGLVALLLCYCASTHFSWQHNSTYAVNLVYCENIKYQSWLARCKCGWLSCSTDIFAIFYYICHRANMKTRVISQYSQLVNIHLVCSCWWHLYPDVEARQEKYWAKYRGWPARSIFVLGLWSVGDLIWPAGQKPQPLYWTLAAVRPRSEQSRKVAVEPVAVEVVQTHNLINLPSSPLKCNCSCFGAICKVLSEEINLFDFVRIFGKSSTYNFNNGSVRLPADQNLAHLTGHQTNCLPDLWHLGSLKALPPPSIHLNMEDMGNGAKKKERKLLKIGEQIHW